LGDFSAHPQPEASPHVFFGGEEWLKDSFQVLRSDPRTMICYLGGKLMSKNDSIDCQHDGICIHWLVSSLDRAPCSVPSDGGIKCGIDCPYLKAAPEESTTSDGKHGKYGNFGWIFTAFGGDDCRAARSASSYANDMEVRDPVKSRLLF
jgi:hypothetical protein